MNPKFWTYFSSESGPKEPRVSLVYRFTLTSSDTRGVDSGQRQRRVGRGTTSTGNGLWFFSPEEGHCEWVTVETGVYRSEHLVHLILWLLKNRQTQVQKDNPVPYILVSDFDSRHFNHHCKTN